MEKDSKYNSRSSQKVKAVLAFVHEHYEDKLPMKEITASALISERM